MVSLEQVTWKDRTVVWCWEAALRPLLLPHSEVYSLYNSRSKQKSALGSDHPILPSTKLLKKLKNASFPVHMNDQPVFSNKSPGHVAKANVDVNNR